MIYRMRIIGQDFSEPSGFTIAGCGVTSVFYIDICFVKLHGSVQAIFLEFPRYTISVYIWAFAGSGMAKNCWGRRVATHIDSPCCMIRLDGVFTGS
jgi:hypothetical protein